MTTAMTYKGYTANIEYDDDDGLFVGRIAGIRDGVGFHAEQVGALRAAFVEAVDDYLETCQTIGKEPARPGQPPVMLRVAPEVHRRAVQAAARAGKTPEQWAEDVLGQAARLGN